MAPTSLLIITTYHGGFFLLDIILSTELGVKGWTDQAKERGQRDSRFTSTSALLVLLALGRATVVIGQLPTYLSRNYLETSYQG